MELDSRSAVFQVRVLPLVGGVLILAWSVWGIRRWLRSGSESPVDGGAGFGLILMVVVMVIGVTLISVGLVTYQ